jgi:N-acetylglucosamine-6-phosphate deacetylase
MDIVLEGGSIASATPIDGPFEVTDADDWVAPAFWDLQINGRWGVSFSDPTLTVDQVAAIVRAQASLGTARLCPTLITAPQADMLHGVRTIAEACERFPDVARMVLGIHLEGPSISELDGYRGAHPLEAVRGPDWDEFVEIREASGNRIAIITLAPERPGAIDFIARASAEGVVIALGHTSADASTIRLAVEAGARLSTHLGNGIASPLPRHDNPIWHQAAEDDLMASLIADGHHLGPSILKSLVRAKTHERILLVSDASPLAGLPPGRYGAWEVDPSGKIVVAGTPYLAGSNQGIAVGVDHLIRLAEIPPRQAIEAATQKPAHLLNSIPGFISLGPGPFDRYAWPEIKAGEPANLIRFRRPAGRGGDLDIMDIVHGFDRDLSRPPSVSDSPRFVLQATCVDGEWTPLEDGQPTAG